MPDDTKKWQDHPVLIAICSGAAALIFAQTVIFPTMTASLQNEVTAARSQAQEVATVKEQLKKATDETAKAKLDLKAAQLINVFSAGNPYPIGLDKVRIGDGLDAILGNFPEASVKKNTPSYWSVNLDHAAFREVVYYFDQPTSRNLKDRRIRALLFFTSDRSSGVIRGKLTAALGNPSISGPKPDCVVWTLSNDLFVRADASDSLFIANTPPSCTVEEK
ncbi:hypothetical protein JJC00_20720 [Bradyrhizobium diazoefficiens]|uniref:hypothetical protein n=1 Tax=Bradyrhizobium diazoefficiens TaxID=1355477 RepID=UPI00190BE79E|nr:hypothetical protein [Bradyrhizobium diazoefficiens]QQO31084.1 hypothetical protein JJC00_20720 [Bradyrhizobium diazoefficiens]